MTVEAEILSEQYAGNGATTDFEFRFKIASSDELVVRLINDSTGEAAAQVLTTHYTVTLDDDGTGEVSMVMAPAVGYTLDLRPVYTIRQATNVRNQGRFLPEIHEQAFDRLASQSQYLKRLIHRSLRLWDHSDGVSGELTPRSSWLGRYVYINEDGEPQPAAAIEATTLTQSIVGAVLYPITDAESDAGFGPSELSLGYPVGDVRRYRIVPNDDTARAANTAALKKLIDATGTSTYCGRVVFPNTTGADTYYFDDIIQLKEGVTLIGNYCTANFKKTRETADDAMGFLTLIRNVGIENLVIDVDYDGTGGVNAGNGLRIGSRPGYPFGSFTDGIEEEDLTEPMGNVAIRNVKVTTNNPVAAPILMLGGIENVSLQNVTIDGQDAATKGIYYEFGFWHTEATAANRESSHARNISFENITIKKLDTSEGVCFTLAGAISARISGLHMDSGFNGLIVRSGEALFYNKGDLDADLKPQIVLENITGANLAGTGIALTGAESSSGGYLNTVIGALDAGPKAAAQTDLLSFSLDGFSIEAGGVGLNLSGPAIVRNGSLHGGATSGQLIITDECVRFTIDNVRVVGSSNVGIRANFGAAIYGTPRLKSGVIRNCVIAGNTGAGITIDDCRGVLIENNIIGHNEDYTGVEETTQSIGVIVGIDGSGVVCRGNYVSTSGGGTAYTLSGTGSRGCAIETAQGTTTFTGAWEGVLQSAELTLTAATPGDLAVTYSERTIEYIKRGKRVDYQLRVETTAFTHTTASGNLRITGLPVAVSSTALGYSPGAMSLQGITKASYTQFTLAPSRGNTYAHVEASGSAQNVAVVAITDLPTGGTVRLRASGHYFVA